MSSRSNLLSMVMVTFNGSPNSGEDPPTPEHGLYPSSFFLLFIGVTLVVHTLGVYVVPEWASEIPRWYYLDTHSRFLPFRPPF